MKKRVAIKLYINYEVKHKLGYIGIHYKQNSLQRQAKMNVLKQN